MGCAVLEKLIEVIQARLMDWVIPADRLLLLAEAARAREINRVLQAAKSGERCMERVDERSKQRPQRA